MEPFISVYNRTLDEAQSQLRIVYQAVRDRSPDQEVLMKLGCFDKATRGSGIATVVAGIYLAAQHHNDPINAVTIAANSLGADTDTVGSFAGGLLGALHGIVETPARWRTVQDCEYLTRIARRLLAISEDRVPADDEVRTDSDLRSLDTLGPDDYSVGLSVSSKILGIGKVMRVDRQDTLTKGKYNLVLHVAFDIGQTCVFNILFDNSESRDVSA